ncbi:MAG: uroporphyrinogen-III C-methyltransferase [Thalassotalea sp.]
MTDNKLQSDQNDKPISNANADEKAQVSATSADPASVKSSAASSKPAVDKSPVQPQVKKPIPARRVPKTPVSKIAVLAFLLSLFAIATIVFGYLWFEKQQVTFSNAMLKKVEQQAAQQLLTKQAETKQNLQAETKQLLKNQQRLFEQQLQQLSTGIAADNKNTIDKLQKTVDRLNATKPTDWLIHEAEYLVRVAGRTIWLEKDTQAAIALLQDADQRLKELKNPKFLAVRTLLHQDIEMLKSLPVINTEEVILTLMGLASQIDKLPLALAYVPDAEHISENFELSDNTDDWQENLNKTWQRFLGDFITVRRRSANVEPLLTPVQKQNLVANLKLKLQQTQWAATKGQSQLYQQTLADVQAWLVTYFDMDEPANQSFYQSVENLKSERVFIEYPAELTALAEIQQVILNQSYREQSPVINQPDEDPDAVNESSAAPQEAIEQASQSAEAVI